MADNTILSTNVGTGNTLRTLEDGSSIHWPAGVTAYATTVGTPDVLQIVTPTAGLPVQQQTGATFTIVGTGTFVAQVSGDALTALQLIDDAVATAGSAITAKGMAAVGTDGTNARVLKTDASGELQVDVLTMPSVAVTNSALTELELALALPSEPIDGANHRLLIGADADGGNATGLACTSSGALHIHDGGNSITVDGTVAVSGTVTVGSHAVTNAGTFVVQENGAALTSLQLLDDVVFVRGTGGANTDKGIQLWGTRNDAAAGYVDVADLDVSPISVDSGGRVGVCDLGGSITVDNGGTFAVQAAQSGTWNITNISGTISLPTGAATAAKQPAIGTAGTASADVITVQGIASMTALKVDGSAVTQPVSNAGTFAVQAAQSGTWTVTGAGGTFPVTDSGGSLTVDAPVGTPVFVRLSDGSAAITTLPVSLASVPSHAVTNAGTFAVQVDGAALTSLQLLDDAVSGSGFNISQLNGVAVTMGNGASGTGVQRVTIANDSTGILAGVTTVTTVTTCSTVTTLSTLTGGGVAHDGADSGNPHKIGAKATTSMAGITLVANADRTDLLAGVDGALIVRPECSLEDVVQERTTNTDGASTAFASGLAAPGAGIRLWVKSVTICNSSASFCTVDLRDGAAGSVLWTLPVPATGGVTHVFEPPLKLTANTALAFDASAAITTLTISANAFKSKV